MSETRFVVEIRKELDRLRNERDRIKGDLAAAQAELEWRRPHEARVAELEVENAQHVEEIGRLHADILKLRGWEATPDGMREVAPSRVAELESKARAVLSANDDFRAGMPAGWEGDPLQDACADLRAALNEPAQPRPAQSPAVAKPHINKMVDKLERRMDDDAPR